MKVPSDLYLVGNSGDIGRFGESIFSPSAFTYLGNPGGWAIRMLTRAPDDSLYSVGSDGNVGVWDPVGARWIDENLKGGWTLKMLAWEPPSLPERQLWCVGTNGNVGVWDETTSGWSDKGFLGGWSLNSLAFDREGQMWGVGTEGNLGQWNNSDSQWVNFGNFGEWTLLMIAFDDADNAWAIGTRHDLGFSPGPFPGANWQRPEMPVLNNTDKGWDGALQWLYLS